MVEFLGVALLTVVALLGVAQVAMWTWARNVAVNAAHEGARTAAEPGRPLDDGAVRTRQLLHDGLGGAAAAFAVQAAQTGDEVEVAALGDAAVAQDEETHGYIAVLTFGQRPQLTGLRIKFVRRERERILQPMGHQQGTGAVDIPLLHDQFDDGV